MAGRTLTTGEIAKYCDVNLRTVIRWIREGHLKAFQLPGRGDNRVELEDFLGFLSRHRMPVPPDIQPRSGKPRVLIVDDEPSMIRSIERVLRRLDVETEVAEDGFRTGLLLESFEPDLMTLDLKMPGLGGIDVLNLVKSRDDLRKVRILVVSGADTEEALKAGADDVLLKPFEEEALLEKASRLLGIRVT